MMAFAPVQLFSTPFENYSGYWVKFYEQGTTTPLSMATDSTGGTLIVKAEISSGGTVDIGFIKTAGDALLIPFVNGDYDGWLFPTSAEADANDTTNAIQVADNLNADPASGILASEVSVADADGMYAGSNVEAVLAEVNSSVDDIASLRSIEPTAVTGNKKTIYIRGHSAAGDGGGGQFYWDSVSTETDNNGTIIKVTAVTTGRWKRLFNGFTYAAWFGAVGGLLIDNAVGINAAIESLNPIGGIVILPRGSFNVDTTIFSNSHSIMLIGHGQGGGRNAEFAPATMLLASAGHTGPVIRFDTADAGPTRLILRGCGLRDLGIDVQNAHTITAVQIRSLEDGAPVFQNVLVTGNSKTALDIGTSVNVGAGQCAKIWMHNFISYGNTSNIATDAAVKIDDGLEMMFRDCSFLTPTWANGVVAVRLIPSALNQGPRAFIFDGCTTGGYGIHYTIEGGASTTTGGRHVRWISCRFESYNIGIHIAGKAGAISQFNTVYAGNSFVSARDPDGSLNGTTSIKVKLDYANNNEIHVDEFTEPGGTGRGVTLTANAAGNSIYGPPTAISDLGTSNLVLGRSSTSYDVSGLAINSGADIIGHQEDTLAWDVASLVDGASEGISVTSLSGLSSTDIVGVSLSSITDANWQLSAFVTSATAIRVVLTNHTGGTVDLPLGTLRVNVWKY